MQYLLVSLFACVAIFDLGYSQHTWNGLYATWTPVPQRGFDAYPRDLTEKHNFVFKDNLCDGVKFRGQRYWSKSDPAIMLLFDKNGIIAGMQSSAPKDKFTPGMARGFVDDGAYWTQTFYFVNPDTICNKGRTKADLEKEGTGTGFWIQYGPDPKVNIINLPLSEQEIKKTLWGSGRCLPSMGQHYWLNVTENMSCMDFFPSCLLVNNGTLNGFCLAKNVFIDSPLYDFPHPVPSALKATLDPVPKCFFEKEYADLSSLHVYFHSNPRETTKC
jgi:hypothetical protein